MKDVMVDLETLGQTPGCAILSIGAIAFDPFKGVTGNEFYTVINTESCLKSGLDTDQSTIDWWAKQEEAARSVLMEAANSGESLAAALTSFQNFLAQYRLSNVLVWGNGSDFDNAILACAYRAVGSQLPWKFWNNRCYRTLKNLKPSMGPKRVGTYHNALDDARTQALHAMELLRS